MKQKMSWTNLEFIQRPSSRFLNLSVAFLIGTFGLGILASFFIHVDVSVNVEGEVKTDVGVREAYTPTAGYVTQVLKESGDQVKEGEVIAFLSPDGLSSEELDQSLEKLNQSVQQFSSHADLENVKIPEFTPMHAKIQDSFVLQNLVGFEQASKSFLDQRRYFLVSLRKEIEPLQRRSQILIDKIVQMKKSKKKDLLYLYIESSEEEVGKLRSQILNTQNQSRMKMEQAASEVVRTARIAYGSLEAFKKAHEIRSPTAGTIAKLEIRANSNVLEKTTAATIIPHHAKYVAQIKIAAKDIVKVRKNQSVFYKVEAYPYQHFGFFTGQVQSYEQLRNPAGTSTQADYFVTGSILPPNADPSDEAWRLMVGMKFNGYIRLGQERLSRKIYNQIFGNH